MASMRISLVLMLLLISIPMFMAMGRREHDGEEGEEWPKEREEGDEEEDEEKGGMFILHHLKQVMKTEAGQVSVLRGYRGSSISSSMQIGFVNMEPKALMIPQYIDADVVFFVRRGKMKVGWIYKDHMVEKNLRTGDVYRIPAGSPFYFLNTEQTMRLQVICSIDTTESLISHGTFQSFFIAGGQYPSPVLAGFDLKTLTTAFNVTADELSAIMGRQQEGPIIFLPAGHEPGKNWNPFTEPTRTKQDAVEEDQDMDDEEDEVEEAVVPNWTWRKLLMSFIGEESRNKAEDGSKSAPHAFNLYEKKPDFKNSYGWTKAVDQGDYAPLKRTGVGVFLVNLTAGSMLAPHVNPRATEYGVILGGSGTIQVAFPNGTSAMNAHVREGDVFWVPRYFPFCQIASRSGPLEFFGFTTSARKNRPQFLVGATSVLTAMKGSEIAAAFGVSRDRYERLVQAQKERVILPAPPMVPAQEEGEVGPSLRKKW